MPSVERPMGPGTSLRSHWALAPNRTPPPSYSRLWSAAGRRVEGRRVSCGSLHGFTGPTKAPARAPPPLLGVRVTRHRFLSFLLAFPFFPFLSAACLRQDIHGKSKERTKERKRRRVVRTPKPKTSYTECMPAPWSARDPAPLSFFSPGFSVFPFLSAACPPQQRSRGKIKERRLFRF